MKTIFKKKKKLDAEFQFILLRFDNSNNFPRQGGNSIESGQRPRMEKSRWARKVDVLIRLLWVSRRIVSGSRYGEASSTLIAISPFNEAARHPGGLKIAEAGFMGANPRRESIRGRADTAFHGFLSLANRTSWSDRGARWIALALSNNYLRGTVWAVQASASLR